MRKQGSAIAVLALLLCSGACITTQQSLTRHVEASPPEVVERRFTVSGSRGNTGAVTIRVEPGKQCVETTTVTRQTTRQVIEGKYVSSGFFALAGLTAIVASLKVQPAAESTNLNSELCETLLRDHPICRPYFSAKKREEKQRVLLPIYRGVVGLMDIISIYRYAKARTIVARQVPEIREQSSKQSTCSPSCALTGKKAYLRVTMRDQSWCLRIGTFGPGNVVMVPADFRKRQAGLLPEGVRREFLSAPLDAFFYEGQIVVPECGERRDCLFWRD
jgi:hypothetical protein